MRERSDDSLNICTVPPVDGLPYRFFVTNIGDGTGTFNLIGNYSSVATDFWYEASSKYIVSSVILAISDSSSFNQGDYGAIPGGLTNGVGFFIQFAGGPEVRLVHPENIKHNYEWLAITKDTTLTNFAGNAQTLVINFDVVGDFGMPLTMNKGDRFILRLNDDLTGLIFHTCGLRGRKL